MPRNSNRVNEEDTFLLGDTIAISVSFEEKNPDGTYTFVTPNLVKLFIKRPNGNVLTIDGENITNPSIGNYEYQHTFNYPGRWSVRWEAFGLDDEGENRPVGVQEEPVNIVSSSVIG